MTRTFEVEVAQILYWLVTIEHESEADLEDAIDEILEMGETDDFDEMNDHYSFAAQEERRVKILAIDGEKFEQ